MRYPLQTARKFATALSLIFIMAGPASAAGAASPTGTGGSTTGNSSWPGHHNKSLLPPSPPPPCVETLTLSSGGQATVAGRCTSILPK